MRRFEPLFRNPHLATIAGNFWRRPDLGRWQIRDVLYRTEPEVEVLVHSQQPDRAPLGDLVLVHGLEGSADAGYIRSLSCAALEHGWAAHRFNMRGCGGTEHLALTSYHAGQTSDLRSVLEQLRATHARPIFLTGFSLGGNVALKLAAELSQEGSDLLSGVCAISTPIDLAACAAALAEPRNRMYQRRFLNRLKDRIRRRHGQAPHLYTLEHLPKIKTIEDFDDHYTARLFGFGTAQNYFMTQSSNRFLADIRIPALLIQAADDPMIPFSVYDHPAFASNPRLELVAVEHGGHLGFLSRRKPRFWVDEVVMEWLAGQPASNARNIAVRGNVP